MSSLRADTFYTGQVIPVSGTLNITGSFVTASFSENQFIGTSLTCSADSEINWSAANFIAVANNASGSRMIGISGSSVVFASEAGWAGDPGNHTTSSIRSMFVTMSAIDNTKLFGSVFVGSGSAWVQASGSAARHFLGVGQGYYATKTLLQNITTEATVAWQNNVVTSSEVSLTSNEFIVQQGYAGVYEIQANFTILLNGGSGAIAVWLTDDTASQGTDVELTGTRNEFEGAANDRGSLAITALVVLDVGDTVRVRAVRTVGASTNSIDEGSIIVKRIAA